MIEAKLCRVACGALMGLALACGGLHAQTASLPDFTGIVQKNAPAVVHVEAKYGTAHRAHRRQGQGMPDDPQLELFRRFFGVPIMPSPQEQERTSLGSGFVLSSDGYILTNNHVVEGADSFTVRLQDHRSFTAKMVGADPTYDIALLKVDAGGPLPAVSIGDSRLLKPGQWVLAIGSPFGFDYTVTQGIVSAVGRNLGGGDQPYTSFIQTDVPINRGNSGGPLFNLQGQVVGINSQIYSNTGGYLGVAFSIPIDVAMHAVEQIKTKGYVTRGQLGVQLSTVSEDMVKALHLSAANGAAVARVEQGSPADKAGVQPGDIIVSYNGQAISSPGDLPPIVGLTTPGTHAMLDVIRDGKRISLPVVIAEAPHGAARDQGQGGGSSPGQTGLAALGFTVRDLDAQTRQQLRLRPGEGVAIDQITGPAAAAAGLQSGDVILMVGQQRVGSAAVLREAVRNVKPGSTVLLLINSGGDTQFLALTVPTDNSLPDDGQ